MKPIHAVFMVFACAACTPTVKLEAPDKPIEFNVNINITQEVRVRIDRELEDTFAANPGILGLPMTGEK